MVMLAFSHTTLAKNGLFALSLPRYFSFDIV